VHSSIATDGRRLDVRQRDLEHKHDREIIVATDKARRAREGRGYVFRAPELRKERRP
jgi:hypothetical protein